MNFLPPSFEGTISKFSFAFRKEVYVKAKILLTGAIICPGSRTICNILRSVGLRKEKNFPKYHRFLSQDKWSSKWLSEQLLNFLIDVFIPRGEPIVFGIDDTIERRWGSKIKKRGIYRDPVRSSKSHFVKCSGLRWLSLMLLTGLPWLSNGMYWALPVLTILCPSERYYTERGESERKLTDRARQMISWIARRCGALNRPIFITGDGSFATLELFMHAQGLHIGMIARMKLNARLYELPSENYPSNKRGPRPPVGDQLQGMEETLTDKNTSWLSLRLSEWYGNTDKEMLVTWGVAIWRKNNRQLVKIKWVLLIDPEGKLEPTLLGCTDFEASAEDIIRFFVRRWRVEVTFEEVRRHLGVETHRQWSDLAIDRTTPCLLALFSLICLFAYDVSKFQKIEPNHTAWYQKTHITFSDILTTVRLQIIRNSQLLKSSKNLLFNNSKSKIRWLEEIITLAAA